VCWILATWDRLAVGHAMSFFRGEHNGMSMEGGDGVQLAIEGARLDGGVERHTIVSRVGVLHEGEPGMSVVMWFEVI